MSKILVIGDLIIDTFTYGNVTRVSPEAPNLILDFNYENTFIGGAYNIIKHLRSLNCEAHFLSISGSVGKNELDLNLDKHKDYIIWDNNRLLSIKTRFISEIKTTTLFRLDKEETKNFDEDTYELVFEKIKQLEPEIIIISDYNKGLINQFFMSKLFQIIKTFNIKILVDSKRSDLSIFEKAFLVKPNKHEFSYIKAELGDRQMSDAKAALLIYQLYKISELIITKGENGISRYSKGMLKREIDAFKINPLEFSGAGDSVMAIIGYGLYNNIDLNICIEMANKGAAKFIQKGPSYRIVESDIDGKNV